LRQKDLRLALESARQLRLPLPGLALVHQLFCAVEAKGCGEEGTQALVKALEALGNVQVGGRTPPSG
jgi:3-hydroxyisobutyrate dehydrogenase